jgi:hypothetical protein
MIPLAPRLIVTSPGVSSEADGIVMPAHFDSACITSGAHQLREVRRADLLLSLADQDEVHGDLAAGVANGMERRQERGFRSFLVHRAAPDDDLAQVGLVHP